MSSWLTRLLRGGDAPVLTPAITGPELLARLDTLRRTSFREGYDTGAVIELVGRCAAALDGTAADPVSDRDVLGARLPATKVREGYDQDQVDDLLDEVVRALRARSGGPAGTRA